MVYYRCKCGYSEAWGSMPPPACAQCPQCKSDLSPGPNSHREPKAHVFLPQPVETNEGVKHLDRCQYCNRTRKQIEAANRGPDPSAPSSNPS